MYLKKLKYFVFTEKNIDFITHVIIIIDLSFHSKLQLVIILRLYVFISVKLTRVKANSFMHTILSLAKHTNAKAKAIFFNTKCIFKSNTSACTLSVLMPMDMVYICQERQ